MHLRNNYKDNFGVVMEGGEIQDVHIHDGVNDTCRTFPPHIVLTHQEV